MSARNLKDNNLNIAENISQTCRWCFYRIRDRRPNRRFAILFFHNVVLEVIARLQRVFNLFYIVYCILCIV